MSAVIWDMDGVLLDTEPIYLEVESEIVSRYGKKIDPILPKLLGRRAKECAQITVSELDLPITSDEYLSERNGRLLQDMKKCEILPGVEEIVRHLKASGVPCAVATSSPGDLLAAKRVGKDEFFALFDAIICGDDVVNGKPDPEIFLKAAMAIGASPKNCVVFEDAPAGLRAAKEAGMKRVALPNHGVDVALYEAEEPTVIVSSARVLDFDLAEVGLPSLKKQPALF